MSSPRAGVSLFFEDDLRLAVLPLFEAGLVDVLEMSIDLTFDAEVPPWAVALLDFYAERQSLYAHGVHFSPLSAVFEARQTKWLDDLRRACSLRRYQHLSEHFGFMTVPGLSRGAPLPLPFTRAAVAVGRDRIARLADAASVPIGLENLALAFSVRDACEQGAFLEALLAPTDGFLLLDVHNLHCQIASFGLDPIEHLSRYPLERVREIHVSGGRVHHTVADPRRPFRRDTHDDAVPDEVFALLSQALDRCPNVEVVILERLGGTLGTEESRTRFGEDFRRMAGLLDSSERALREEEKGS